jgi:hypothetical protein
VRQCAGAAPGMGLTRRAKNTMGAHRKQRAAITKIVRIGIDRGLLVQKILNDGVTS